MSKLWQIVQAHLDDVGVREAEFARRMGTSPQTLNSWKNRGLKKLPEQRLLVAVAREARTPYRSVIFAALEDVGYWPESAAVRMAEEYARRSGGDGNAPPIVTVTDAETIDPAQPESGAEPPPGPDAQGRARGRNP